MSGNAPERIDAEYDAVVVGAGFAGMYMLHSLRQQGFSARVYEAGDDVGGTWYWNRYPGARCDIESMQYSYSFSEELDQEWDWSEKYAPQPEILAYARHVADKFDLKRDIQFETRVVAARYDEPNARWIVETDRGDRVAARFCIMAVGCLSAANKPPFEGMDDFEGPIHHTGEWPKEGVDFTGKRVAVIGTGSSSIQSIPIIAAQAKQLTVFQRTPNYSVPAWNAPMDPAYAARIKADYPGLRAKARARPTGFFFPFNAESALDANPEARRRQYEEFWARGGLPFLGAYGDLLFDKAANDTIADFAREKIRAVVDDPETADLLCPDNVFGCKRLCVDTGYFETFNEDHVKLVDVARTPIERFSKKGVIHDGVEHEADLIVCATGFAAMTGSFDRIDIVGRDGLTLKKKWEAGPRTYLGLSTQGFPELPDDHGAGQPVRARQHDPVDRAARGLDGGPGGAYTRHRRRRDRADAGGRGRVGRARQRGGGDLPPLDLQLLVCGRERAGPAARVHALYRRFPGLCAALQRRHDQRLRGLRHRRRDAAKRLP